MLATSWCGLSCWLPRYPLIVVHPLLRAAIEADLSPARRSMVHRRAAAFVSEDRERPDRR